MIAFINGDILSMEGDVIETVIIEGDRIKRVGPLSMVKRIKETEIVDLKGRFLAPAFIDSHIHFVDVGLNLTRVDLSKTTSLRDAFDKTKERLEEERKATPLICMDFDESRWRENRIPKKEELDILSKNRAIIFRRICGHIAVGNTMALECIPEGFNIDYNTGILLENAVLFINEVFPPDKDEIVTAIINAQNVAHSLGITSVHDMTLRRYLDVYTEMEKRESLRIRVYAILPVKDMDYIYHIDGEWLKTGGIKVFADGSIGARTAAVKKPYPGSDNYGVLNYKKEELKNIVKRANNLGFQILIHAIGDRAIEQALDVYESEGNPFRHRIEHFELADDGAVIRAKKQGIILAMQPNFITNWGMPDGLYQRIFGLEGLNTNRFKTASKAGNMICFGSDSMPPGPIYGIKGAMEHPTESVSFEKAVRMYTINSAYAGNNEKLTGSIEIGKKADLVVLSGKPPHMSVDMTVVNGEIVYQSE